MSPVDHVTITITERVFPKEIVSNLRFPYICFYRNIYSLILFGDLQNMNGVSYNGV